MGMTCHRGHSGHREIYPILDAGYLILGVIPSAAEGSIEKSSAIWFI